jgi:hypothetical protein
MSGWRTCGSSTGSASKTISERDSVASITPRRAQQGHLPRVAEVDRKMDVRLGEQHESRIRSST